MRKIIFILFLFPCFLFGQDRTIDSLKLALKNAKHDTTKLLLRNIIGEVESIFRLSYWDSLYVDSKKLGIKGIEASSLNNIGYIYKFQGDVLKALEYYHKSLKIDEEIENKIGVVYSLNNIGVIYYNQRDIPKALEYFHKSLQIDEEIGDKGGKALTLSNIGACYHEQRNVPKALEYYNKSLKIQEEIENKIGIGSVLNNIGNIYKEQSDLSKALEYYHKGLKIIEETGDKKTQANSLNNIAILIFKKGKTEEALEFANRGMQVAKETAYPEIIKSSASTLKKIFQKQNKYKEAFEMYELEIKMRDSINNEETQKAAVKKQMQYQYETQARELKNEQEKKDLLAKAELQQREKERNYFVIGFALVIVLAGFIFRSYRQKQKANILITHQKKEVEESKKEILDSIHYAKRIQKAHLPTLNYIEKNLNRLQKKG